MGFDRLGEGGTTSGRNGIPYIKDIDIFVGGDSEENTFPGGWVAVDDSAGGENGKQSQFTGGLNGWTYIKSDSHAHNYININDSPSFPKENSTTTWPAVSCRYLLVRVKSNHGYTYGRYQIAIDKLQLKFGIAAPIENGFTPNSGHIVSASSPDGPWVIRASWDDATYLDPINYRIVLTSFGIQQSPPTMEWVWPADNSIVSDMNDYHPRFEDGTTTTGGYNGSMPLVNACTDADSPGGFMESTFLTAANYGVFGWHESNTVEMYDSPSYVDFIFTFTDPNTWCSGYRQFGQIEGGTNTFTKDIDIYTGDANFGPWTKVATDSHTTWHNDATNTFPDDGTTTMWTPTAPSKYLLIRTNSNHGDEGVGGRLTVRFLQLKLGI